MWSKARSWIRVDVTFLIPHCVRCSVGTQEIRALELDVHIPNCIHLKTLIQPEKWGLTQGGKTAFAFRLGALFVGWWWVRLSSGQRILVWGDYRRDWSGLEWTETDWWERNKDTWEGSRLSRRLESRTSTRYLRFFTGRWTMTTEFYHG